MKNTFTLYNKRPIMISIAAFVLSMCLFFVFFSLTSGLPDIVPTHFTNGVGIDGWGAKSELYPIPIIPAVFGVITIPLAVVCTKKGVPACLTLPVVFRFLLLRLWHSLLQCF